MRCFAISAHGHNLSLDQDGYSKRKLAIRLEFERKEENEALGALCRVIMAESHPFRAALVHLAGTVTDARSITALKRVLGPLPVPQPSKPAVVTEFVRAGK
jgi:hypothetical protein